MESAQKAAYSQGQLLLPLLDALQQSGGELSAGAACDAVGAAIGLTEEARQATVEIGGHSYNRFDRDVRWARQRAVLKGLVETPGRAHWRITGTGRKALREAKPGIVITIFETDCGAAVWASCEDAARYIEPGSVDLILSSPPYPLLRKKDYGNYDEVEYVEWLTRLADQWRPLLRDTGSLVLNLGDAWTPGVPVQSLYAERLLLKLCDELGYKLAQKFFWFNPSKLPAPAEWVTVRRCRVKPAIEHIYWLSQADFPYADNRSVLLPYSESMRQRMRTGGERAANRPSGHTLKAGAFSIDNGGSIPPNLLTIANTESNSSYIRDCKAAGIALHPARFPAGLPEFFIKLLTRPGGLVYDPFGGSGTTAQVAEKLGRHWLTTERALDYVQGHARRFGITPTINNGELALSAA